MNTPDTLITCIGCGARLAEPPSICPSCLAEREAHRRAKARARWYDRWANCPACNDRMLEGLLPYHRAHLCRIAAASPNGDLS